jgi:NCS1 family nucleobase:cation symporter-1
MFINASLELYADEI